MLMGGLWLLASGALAQEFFVAPDGRDEHPGTREQPFRTIARAQAAVRAINQRMTRDIVVHLAPGDYRLRAPLRFSTRDSGCNGFRVIYRSRGEPGSARILGSHRLTNWVHHRNGIWQTGVRGAPAVHTLYANGERLRKARHPNHVHQPEFPTAQGPYLVSENGLPKGQRGKGVTTSWLQWSGSDVAPLGPGAEQLRIQVFPWGKADWHRWICKVTKVDAATRRIFFHNMGDATEILGQARYFLEDALPYLDQPGEFFLEQRTGRLFLVPPPGLAPAEMEIEFPLLMDLIRVEGDSPARPVERLVFEGLRLEYTNTRSPTLHWWTLDWGRRDHALIWMMNTREIEIRACHLRNSGRNGIMMIGEARNNRVESCWIEQMGINGLTLCNRFNQNESGLSLNHVLTNNKIHDVGQIALYAACINVFNSSRNEVSHSELFRSPRYAVTVRGHTLSEEGALDYMPGLQPAEGNRFHHLRVYECGHDSGDMGAVHLAGTNLKGGPFLNTFEQITIRNVFAAPGMNDAAPDGIFLDWPDRTMNQVFRDIRIGKVGGRKVRSNKPGNRESARWENVSGTGGSFDGSRIESARIGLRDDFPFGRSPPDATDPEMETTGDAPGEFEPIELEEEESEVLP